MKKINTIIVCGLGAMGSNVLYQLSRMYPDMEYVGVDFDKIEPRNLATQVYFKEQVNMQKAVAMLSVLARNGAKNYKIVNSRIESTEAINKYITDLESTIVLDCFDNVESRALVKAVACESFHMGFSTHYTAELKWKATYTVPDKVNPNDADICTLRDAAAFISFVANFGVMQISEFIETGVKKNHIITKKYDIKQVI